MKVSCWRSSILFLAFCAAISAGTALTASALTVECGASAPERRAAAELRQFAITTEKGLNAYQFGVNSQGKRGVIRNVE